jgi:hypothetical protein
MPSVLGRSGRRRRALGGEFGAPSGDGQAVNDEIQTLKTNLATFVAANEVLLRRYFANPL